ncbi:pentapeptide repeat-containing protein [Saccharothrix variisporea]|uniref:Membrane-associated oxidoreductase n=1 Tax=Saccharothrix variisporea TaxID=543527 RepID=A0A495XGG6_9PSEU|nr:hypothetical protein [Saccharothrix variisporea]RKT71663.1 hypothetical protein DFJ66_4956 [Saccharothrix variisporea]
MTETGARGLDVFDPDPPRAFRMPAADVLRGLGEGAFRLGLRRPSVPPVIRVEDRFLTGVLDLRAVELNYLLEFVRCRFEEAPDLRQGRLAGVVFTGCRLPGLWGRNLSSANEVSLAGSTVEGVADLTDADIAGSLELRDARLVAPGGLALHADRVKLAGALLGQGVSVSGELRLAGAQVGGNCNFSGGTLTNPRAHAVNATGVHVGGNLLFSGSTIQGTVLLANARVDSALTLRGASVTAGKVDEEAGLDPHADPASTLVLDRVTVDGDVQLDREFRSAGTVRMVNATLGGSLSLSGGHFDARPEAVVDGTVAARAGEDSGETAPVRAETALEPAETPPAVVDVPSGQASAVAEPTGFGRALHLDGAQIGGDVVARQAFVRGQIRMVDLQVKGSLTLDGSELDNPRADAVLGNRSHIGSNLTAREVEVAGGLELRGVRIGANLDLRGSRITKPGRYRHMPAGKPSLDVGGAVIGRDLICAGGVKEFVAHGGVRARRAQVGRMANFSGAVLGDKLDSHALNALGLQVQELVLTPISPPRGDVTLRQVRCTSLDDNEAFWSATGWIDLEEFRYDSLRNPIDLRDDDEVDRRLRWLRQAMRRSYRPGPYDQFAEMLRACGNDEHAATVLVEKQRLRYRAVAEGRRWLGPLVLVWSWLQRSMVGYGYRPARALGWLVVSWVLGSIWFSAHDRLEVINSDDRLSWNPWLFTIDLVVPIVDFGNKNRWQLAGASQWIGAGLIVTGWVLATTVAAGLTRMLKR